MDVFISKTRYSSLIRLYLCSATLLLLWLRKVEQVVDSIGTLPGG